MPEYAVFGLTGAYAVVAALLLSLNIASLWRWPVKAGAIVTTTGLIVGSYLAIGAMLGWPSQDRLPARASFLASRIVEPDKLTGAPGVIFVWLQDIDDLNLPVGEPRAYKLGYDRAVASEVVKAQRLRFQGRDVVGSFDYSKDRPDPQPLVAPGVPLGLQQAGDLRDRDDSQGGAGGIISLNQDLRAVFEEMPALPLPDKGPLIYDPNEDY